MTPRGPPSGIPPIIRKPPIAEDLDKLREKPPRATNREPLSTPLPQRKAPGGREKAVYPMELVLFLRDILKA